MTRNEALLKMCDWWGGYLNTEPYKHADDNNGKWSPYYAWQLWTKQAVDFLTKIEPYLELKQANARIAIEFQKRMHRNGGQKISTSELAIREALYQRMKSLNSRGLHLQRLSEKDAIVSVCDSPILKEEQLEVVVKE
jgi:hypothetical protein